MEDKDSLKRVSLIQSIRVSLVEEGLTHFTIFAIDRRLDVDMAFLDEHFVRA